MLVGVHERLEAFGYVFALGLDKHPHIVFEGIAGLRMVGGHLLRLGIGCL